MWLSKFNWQIHEFHGDFELDGPLQCQFQMYVALYEKRLINVNGVIIKINVATFLDEIWYDVRWKALVHSIKGPRGSSYKLHVPLYVSII